MATRILVVEDEFIIAEDISDTLRSLGYEVVGNATNYYEAVKFMDGGTTDLVLVDINLGDKKDGIDVAAAIKEKYKLPFIFITSHADKTTVDRAKNIKPNGYLVKPFDKNDLYTGIEIALSNFTERSAPMPLAEPTEDGTNTVFVKDGTSFIKIKHDDIWFVKSDGNYISIQTSQKKHLIRKTLKDFGSTLPAETFFQVYKSYIINLHHVQSVHSDHVIVKGQEIPIGREFKEAFLKKVNIA
jgi:two-component system response regulator LytT